MMENENEIFDFIDDGVFDEEQYFSLHANE